MASEEIIEIEDPAKQGRIEPAAMNSSNKASTVHKFIKPSISVGGLSSQKNSLKNLVKLKPVAVTKTTTNQTTNVASSATATAATKSNETTKASGVTNTDKSTAPTSALSLLSGYDDDSDDSNQSE